MQVQGRVEDRLMQEQIRKRAGKSMFILEQAVTRLSEEYRLMQAYQTILDQKDFWEKCSLKEFLNYDPNFLDGRIEESDSLLQKRAIVRDAIEFYKKHV